MPHADKDRLAEIVVARHGDFEFALTDKRRKYPTAEFETFAAALRGYVSAIREDKLVHRTVVQAVHGLSEHLMAERKTVPEHVLVEAERLECLLFLGYDPYFEGDEPPGL